MYNFENKRCDNGEGIHYSRIIASWVVANGLRSLELPEEEVLDIYEMATNGRMECEGHAERYIKELTK